MEGAKQVGRAFSTLSAQAAGTTATTTPGAGRRAVSRRVYRLSVCVSDLPSHGNTWRQHLQVWIGLRALETLHEGHKEGTQTFIARTWEESRGGQRVDQRHISSRSPLFVPLPLAATRSHSAAPHRTRRVGWAPAHLVCQGPTHLIEHSSTSGLDERNRKVKRSSGPTDGPASVRCIRTIPCVQGSVLRFPTVLYLLTVRV